MAVIQVENVTKQFGTHVVLDGVSLVIHSGETVGLVGANGSGKTTLFRIIAGALEPDFGTVTRARGLPLGHLEQEPDLDLNRTLHEEVGRAFDHLLEMERQLHHLSDRIAASADNEAALAGLMDRYERVNSRFEAAGGHRFQTRLNEILGGLGFTQKEHGQPLSQLSGGQRCRAALARILLGDPGFLLLDEPTNHLDIDAVRWLEKFLAGHKGGALIVSHDRYLLDRLVTRIIEIEAAQTVSYTGNYSQFAETKDRIALTRRRQFAKDTAFIKKEREFIARHLAGQRTKEAQGRRKRLERMLAENAFVTERHRTQRKAGIRFGQVGDQVGSQVRCDELAMAYDAKQLFSDLTFQVHPGDRFGITGPNGTGKTTLLKIILGEEVPTAGTTSLAAGLKVGYYSQDGFALDPARTAVEEIRSVRTEWSEADARNYLAGFLFIGDDVFKTAGVLSGGEQSRLRLASLILQEPDLLVLDEPTNHLDIPSSETLEEALCAFGGTILLVSHDRYFLDRVVNRLLVLRRDQHGIYDGNYSFYLDHCAQIGAPFPSRDREGAVCPEDARRGIAPGHLEQFEAARSAAGRKPSPGKKSRAKPVKDRSKKQSASTRFDRLSIEELEALVMEREIELAALQERFGDPDTYRDPEILAEIRERMEALSAELAEVDAVWQERVEGL